MVSSVFDVNSSYFIHFLFQLVKIDLISLTFKSFSPTHVIVVQIVHCVAPKLLL